MQVMNKNRRIRTYPNTEQLTTALRTESDISLILFLHGGVADGEITEAVRLVSTRCTLETDATVVAPLSKQRPGRPTTI